jgi:glycosyltransferase involved in cell wall biosynthesis
MLYADGVVFTEKEGYDTLSFFLKLLIRGKEKVIIPVASNIMGVKNLPKSRRDLLKKFGINQKKQVLITFGFISQAKGYEALVKIYDGRKHAWVHLGSAGFSEEYRERFLKTAANAGVKINFTGTLPPKKIAQYLGAGDAVIFTFKEGVSSRNGSFLAARSQGAYIAAFHKEKRGYYEDENTYYTACGDIEGLRKALMFKKHPRHIKPSVASWHEISMKHAEFYEKLLKQKP